MNLSLVDLVVFSLALGICLIWRQQTRSKSHPLPPGPPRKRLIGNLLDIPRQKAWHTFTKWKKLYGDIVYVEALGNSILILNTIETVHDLLEKRANIYSDRPTFVMVGQMMGLDNSLPMLPYGTMLRQHRKICHSALSPEAVKKYYDIQEDATAMFINSLLEKPAEFVSMLRLTAGRIIMSVTYGLPVTTPDDVYISEAETTMEMIGKATVPGAFLVDLIPPLRHIPSWFPFNNIHKTAKYGRNLIYNMISRPFDHVKQEISRGTAQASFTLDCLQSYRSELLGLSDSEAEHLIRWTAGAMYGAGGESTYASILTFIYAMAIYPEVQNKLKHELDSVVGRDRLPAIQDRPHLPYTCATIKEIMRWRPALPLSIARKTNKDDYYQGYFIPAGTIVLPNVWAISTDESSGIPSTEFAPERFLKSEQVQETATDPYLYGFGFGRRVCPGKYLGENNLFLLVSWLIATVEISKKKDVNGVEKPLNPTYTAGLVSHPEPYEVEFTPRSHEASLLVKNRVNDIN